MLRPNRLLLVARTDSTSTACNLLIWGTWLGRHFKLLMMLNVSTSRYFIRSDAYIVCKIGQVLRHWYEGHFRRYFLSRFSLFGFKWGGWDCVCWWLRVLSHLGCYYLAILICLALVSRDSWVSRSMARVKIISWKSSWCLWFVARLRNIGCWGLRWLNLVRNRCLLLLHIFKRLFFVCTRWGLGQKFSFLIVHLLTWPCTRTPINLSCKPYRIMNLRIWSDRTRLFLLSVQFGPFEFGR